MELVDAERLTPLDFVAPGQACPFCLWRLSAARHGSSTHGVGRLETNTYGIGRKVEGAGRRLKQAIKVVAENRRARFDPTSMRKWRRAWS